MGVLYVNSAVLGQYESIRNIHEVRGGAQMVYVVSLGSGNEYPELVFVRSSVERAIKEGRELLESSHGFEWCEIDEHEIDE